MRALLILFLLIVSAGGAGAGQYVRKQVGNDTVVLFVHGVVGDGTSTWTNPRTKAYWPKLLAEDPDFAGANIYVYEYPSPKIGLAYNINEVAEDLRLNIDVDKVLSHKDIIFLSHSMGGLVVRQYLLKYRQAVPKVKFLYFYATPTTGSPVATLASIVSRNPQLGNMKPMRADEYLGNIQRDWLADPLLRELATYCAYEKLPTFGHVIVEQESATNLCNRQLDPIDANHIDIVKPESKKSKAYLVFKSAFLANVDNKNSDDLRVELQNIQQAIKPIGQLPRTAANEDVYCDTVSLSLILAHKALSKTPILINSIAVDAKPIDQSQIKAGERCKIDALSSRPHGIVESNIYSIQIKDNAVVARQIKDKDQGWAVSDRNLLEGQRSQSRISLKYDEEPVGLSMLIHSSASQPQAISFMLVYDQGGQRKTVTKRILLWK